MRRFLIVGFLLSVIFSVQAKTPVNVFVSILPQKYFVEKIGGDKVNVSVLVGPGKSPATFEPTTEQVVSLSKAAVFFTIGVAFETGFLPKIQDSLKSLKIVDTSFGVKKRTMENNKVLDPHIWMSPTLVKIQVKNIFETLVSIDPKNKLFYKNGYENFVKELDEVQAQLQVGLAPLKGKTLFVYHPAFGYFADEFGFKQVAIETGGKEPDPATLMKIISDAKKDNVKVIIVQPEFSQKSAEVIASAIGGRVLMVAPLNPDYINNLKYIASEIKKS